MILDEYINMVYEKTRREPLPPSSLVAVIDNSQEIIVRDFTYRISMEGIQFTLHPRRHATLHFITSTEIENPYVISSLQLDSLNRPLAFEDLTLICIDENIDEYDFPYYGYTYEAMSAKFK